MNIRIAAATALLVGLAAGPASAAPVGGVHQDAEALALFAACTQAVKVSHPDHVATEVPGLGGKTKNCTLRKGDNGPAVKALQKSLHDCYNARLVVDGVFGDQTGETLAVAQQEAKVVADRVFGPKTSATIRFSFTQGKDYICRTV